MENIYLLIAGFVIGIRFEKTNFPNDIERDFANRVHMYYAGFILLITPEKVDFWIDIVYRESFEFMIKTKTKKHFINMYEETNSKTIQTFYYISDMQFRVIIRKILLTLLAKNNGIMLHAAATKIGNSAYVFLGQSGAGKSTAMQMLSLRFPSLGDDTIILKKEGKMFYFYQTPFREKNAWVYKDMTRYTLGKIFFLKKANEYTVENVTDKQHILEKFSEQFFTQEEGLKKQMKSVLQLVSVFESFYLLSFGTKSNEEMVQLFTSISDEKI